MEIREEMSRDAGYDVDSFAEMLRSNDAMPDENLHSMSEANGDGKTDNKIEIKLKPEFEIKRND